MQSYFAVNSPNYFIMKIPNKRELQQIAFNHWYDIDFKDFTNSLQNYFFKWVVLLLHQIIFYVPQRIFQKNIKVVMTIADKIRDEKLQYDIKEKLQKY